MNQVIYAILAAAFGTAVWVTNVAPASAQLARPQSATRLVGDSNFVTEVRVRLSRVLRLPPILRLSRPLLRSGYWTRHRPCCRRTGEWCARGSLLRAGALLLCSGTTYILRTAPVLRFPVLRSDVLSTAIQWSAVPRSELRAVATAAVDRAV